MPLLPRSVTRTAACAAVATAVLAAAEPVHAADVTVRRLAGVDRYATAAAVVTTSCTTGLPVTIVRGDDFADALTATNLAAPTLLTPVTSLHPAAAAALQVCRPLSGTVLGTSEVVSARVERQADELVADLRRTAGADRWSTAAAVYRSQYGLQAQVPADVGGLRTGFLTSGVSYADALSAGPVAVAERLPLLLTALDELPAATREALLHDRGSDTGLQQVVVVGGPAAVSDRVVRQVQALGLRVLRVAGATRQHTAVEVFRFAERSFGWDLQDVVLARGNAFADALAGAAHAGRRGAPLLLTDGVDDLGGPARALLQSRAGGVRSVDVLGDRTAVSDAVVQDAVRASTGTRAPAPVSSAAGGAAP